MQLHGRARLGKRTKDLIPTLERHDIAIIAHEDLDAMGATGLIDRGVMAVINTKQSITGKYPNLGPRLLCEAKIPLLDNIGDEVFDLLQDGEMIAIKGRQLLKEGEVIAAGVIMTEYLLEQSMHLATKNLPDEMIRFIDNTLDYMQQEKELVLAPLDFPDLPFLLTGRPVVVVVRGLGYRADLEILSAYISEANPILLAVDGGADALLEFGYVPHIVIGDMDSISDNALHKSEVIIAHAYPNGECPGEERLAGLGLDYDVVPAPGTSEDLAMLLAHDKGADLIIIVGSHSNMIDFLEKGRKGMASTFLTRLKIGPILLDAKGVSKLYNPGNNSGIVPVFIAALVPIFVFLLLASPWRQYLRLIWLQLRLLVGGI